MHFTFIGLGNPGERYEHTPHNTGRSLIFFVVAKCGSGEFLFDKKSNALTTPVTLGRKKGLAVVPETFMNKSGNAAKVLVKSKKAAQHLIVAYDDLDLPLGSLKISYGRSSGGHNGLESVIKALRTRDFVRIRIGVSPTTPGGKLKKPQGEKAVLEYLLKPWKHAEEDKLKKLFKRALEAAEIIVKDGRESAMSQFN